MSASIGEPFILATYEVPSRGRKSKGKSVAADERPYVFASYSAVPKRNDGQVTIAAQGDGIHILDLADLHPVSSHTFGPSTSFASTPATSVTSEDDKSFRRTYVAVQSAPDVKESDAGKVIWSWKEEVSGDIGTSQAKSTFKLSHEVSHVFVSQSLNSSVLFVGKNGCLTQTDWDFNIRNTWTPPNQLQKAIKVFLFPRRNCHFVSGNAPSDGVLLMLFIVRETQLQVQMLAFSQDGETLVIEPETALSNTTGNIVDISCDASGHLSFLDSTGKWISSKMDLMNGRVILVPTSEYMRLKGFSFIPDKTGAIIRHAGSQAAVLSLGSSFVLLAGLTTSTSEIALLLWDIQYSVLLHYHILPVPSTFKKSSAAMSITLIQGSSSQALLVLSPIQPAAVSGQLRTIVFIVPFNVPPSSTIANAMGRATLGAPWLVADNHDADSSLEETPDVHRRVREEMLERLQDAMDEKPEAADKYFYAWLRGKEDDLNDKAVVPTESGNHAEGISTTDVTMTEGESSKAQTVKARSAPRPAFTSDFIARILQTIVQPDSPSGIPYSPKIFRYFLGKGLVSHSMLQGGVLSALAKHNDWESILECFNKIDDIPESEALRLLSTVNKLHGGLSALDGNDMAVDLPVGIPTVRQVFADILEYPSSPVAWRTALREHFNDVDGLMSLLRIMDGWVDAWSSKELGFWQHEKVTANEDGVPVVVEAKKVVKTSSGSVLPSMELISSFLQAVLDSSFVTILQHTPSHAVLQRLSAKLGPLIAFNEHLDSLLGPLAPFAKAQAKALADAGGGRKKEDIDWRKRRRQIQEQNAISLGPYQVEEIAF